MEESVTETSVTDTSADQAKVPSSRPQVKEFFWDFWRTAKAILLTPQVFFSQEPIGGGPKRSLLIFSLAAGVNAVLNGLFKLDILTVLYTFASILMGILLCSAIASGVFRLIGGKGKFEATLCVLACSKVTLLVGWLPAIQILGWLYSWVLTYIGWRKVHERSEFETAAVVLLSAIVMLADLVVWKFLHF